MEFCMIYWWKRRKSDFYPLMVTPLPKILIFDILFCHIWTLQPRKPLKTTGLVPIWGMYSSALYWTALASVSEGMRRKVHASIQSPLAPEPQRISTKWKMQVVGNEPDYLLCENQTLRTSFSMVFMELYSVLAQKSLTFSRNFKLGVAIRQDPSMINWNWQFYLTVVTFALFYTKLQLIIFENVISGIFLFGTYFFNNKAFFSTNFCKYATKIDITAGLPELWLPYSKNSDNSA